MSEKYRIRNFELTKKDLINLEPALLRALIHERAHHVIEVSIYQILKGERKAPPNYGEQVKILLDIWEERGMLMDLPDIKWAKKYLKYAEAIKEGNTIHLDTEMPETFLPKEMETVEKLLFERRSIRRWINKEVSDEMINKVIIAGLAAPNACNMQCQRFLILKDEESKKIIKGDVPLAPVKIVICQDMRIYEWMGFPEQAPQNIYLDAAAAADHMVLMAHALGLGGVWLTHTKEQAERLRKHLGLPDYLRMDTHIALGWSDEAPIKSARIPIQDAIVKVNKQ
jgi:nitroreductase